MSLHVLTVSHPIRGGQDQPKEDNDGGGSGQAKVGNLYCGTGFDPVLRGMGRRQPSLGAQLMVEFVRDEVVYSGQVQGVGFRWTAAGIAKQFEVMGYVRNLSDGRVELVVEGVPAELDRFLKAIRAEMAEKIGNETRNRTAATSQFVDFAIQR